ncbi:hypothetical protein GCM10023176_50010 [Micromonospora coerulea]|uniref:Uncharacterized protein n=1 Tax=Micromonospora coerulea TaxID=47856 RepID=A0ABP8SZ10_9ACTN|nr:hypothetical protein [Micromonospora veneta]
MTEPEESREDAERPEPIIAPPTANPSRVKMPPKGPKERTDEGEPAPAEPPPGEEA